MAALTIDDIEARDAAERALAAAKRRESDAIGSLARVRIDSKTVILARPGQAERFIRQLEADRQRYH